MKRTSSVKRVKDLNGILCLLEDGHCGVHSTFLQWQATKNKSKLVQAFEGQTSIRCEPLMFWLGKLFPYFFPSLLFFFYIEFCLLFSLISLFFSS